jgi:hypothetical protein
MPAEHVLFSLRGKEAGARDCFALTEPPARGRVRVAWDIAQSGKVRAAAVAEANLDLNSAEPSVTECLTRFVTGLHFDAQAQPVRAEWTFVSGVADPQILVDAQKLAKKQRGKKGFTKRTGKSAQGRHAGPRIDAASRGRLPTERIESVAEAGFRLYAHCLREGLSHNTFLSGRVLLHFTIDTDGKVQDVTDAGSDLPDLNAIDCIAQGFYALSFPAPSGGPVGITYPIVLNEE